MVGIDLRRMAWLAALMASGAMPVHAEDPTLAGVAAWRTLVGNTVVVTTKGGGYTEFYDPGGSVRRLDADGTTQGQWQATGDTVCFDYPDDDDHVCLAVSVQGAAGRFTDPDGTADAFEILSGNAKNL